MMQPTPLLVLAAMLMSGCASAVPVGGGPSGIWTVVAIDGRSVATNGATPTLAFEAGRVSGHSGCNQYSGLVRIAGSGLEIGPVVSTRMACLDQAANETERMFLDALTVRARGWSMVSRRLILNDGAGTVVVEAVR